MSEVEPAVAQAVEKRAQTFKHSALTGVSIEVAFGCHFGLRVRFETHRRSVHESLGRSLCYDTVSSFAGLVVAREPTKVSITGFRNGL